MEQQLALDEMVRLADKILDWEALPMSCLCPSKMIDEVESDLPSTSTSYNYASFVYQGKLGKLESTIIQVLSVSQTAHRTYLLPSYSGRRWHEKKTTFYAISVNTDGIDVGYFQGDQVRRFLKKLEVKIERRGRRKADLRRDEQRKLLLGALSTTRSLLR